MKYCQTDSPEPLGFYAQNYGVESYVKATNQRMSSIKTDIGQLS